MEQRFYFDTNAFLKYYCPLLGREEEGVLQQIRRLVSNSPLSILISPLTSLEFINKVMYFYHCHTLKMKNIRKIISIQSPVSLQPDLDFELRHHPYSMNEQTSCESLIYPSLREVWKRHLGLQIWSHLTLQVDDELIGIPDYLVSKKSPRGLTKLEIPLVAVIEAKQENFAAGWGQCLAGLVAAQKLNSGLNPQPSRYGIVTTGKSWEFGQLEGNEVKIHPFSLSLAQLEVLLGALDYTLWRCEAQLARQI